MSPSLRRLIFRPWPAALLVGCLGLALFGAAGLWLANRQAEQAEAERLQTQGQRFLERIEQIFGQLGRALDELEQQPLRGCDMAMVETLRRVVFQHRFVYEAAFIGGDQRCSSSPRRSSFGPERPADLEGERQRYWLNTTAQPDDDLAALVVGRGYFRLSTSRGHLADMVELPPGGSLLIVPRGGGAALPVLGTPQTWPPAAGWPQEQTLLVTPGQLVYRMPTASADFDLVLFADRSLLQQRLRQGLAGWLPVAVLLALLAAGGTYHLVSYRQSLGGSLTSALRRRALRVRYQPIYDLGSRRCVGAEALVRWRRADGKLLGPDHFIPMAESSGQIREITDYMLEQVMAQLGALLREQPGLYISINLAACDVAEPRISALTSRLLLQYQVRAAQIAFEVTESGLADIQAAKGVLAQLRESGHRVLIDDFGTGYSSLAYLQELPADVLKIDKSFVDALGHDAASSGVAPHIIQMAAALHLKVVAEGIEHEAQALFLAAQGAECGQGWLFAKPLTARQFRRLLERQAA
ncbi:EAL domain-containing protein [Pseudomonas sp. Gutcm_11s]|uniref:EAL domain-containing protein n=1 Tax=Pseudomonas sp. Gutcm_11s TaxID=3026088 RepID=UPI00235E528D|nr:EAL domain-containing protein [Pseudomonas sp. Gutcm_11s]MDD0844950.1 EAL domain-containing protein [Pseudomonas sp. Gutcm_11s]